MCIQSATSGPICFCLILLKCFNTFIYINTPQKLYTHKTLYRWTECDITYSLFSLEVMEGVFLTMGSGIHFRDCKLKTSCCCFFPPFWWYNTTNKCRPLLEFYQTRIVTDLWKWKCCTSWHFQRTHSLVHTCSKFIIIEKRVDRVTS